MAVTQRSGRRRTGSRSMRTLDAVEAAGLGSVTFHALRHSHASFLIAQGIDVVTIAARLGHKDSTATLSVYGHLMPGRDQAAADAIDEVFAGTDLRAKPGESRERPPDSVVSIGL